MMPSNGHNGNGFYGQGTVDRSTVERGTVVTDDRPIGSLFRDLTQQVRDLLALELALAKTELSHKVAATGKDVAFIAAGGFIAYAGFLAILAAIIVALSGAMDAWLAALIVGVVVGLVGYVLVRRGMSSLKGRSFTPQRTLSTLQADKDAIRQAASGQPSPAGGTHDDVR